MRKPSFIRIEYSNTLWQYFNVDFWIVKKESIYVWLILKTLLYSDILKKNIFFSLKKQHTKIYHIVVFQI